MPPKTLKVDRSTLFGNPFGVPKYGRDESLRLHRAWLNGAMTDEEIAGRYPAVIARHLIDRRIHVLRSLVELRWMNLACWCQPAEACHADLLLEFANRPL